MTTVRDFEDMINDGPETWDNWTDEWVWELYPVGEPAIEDVRWYCDDDDLAEAIDEDAAFFAAALDAIERSLIPDDVAHLINQTSLAGSPDPDEILHSGADERWCVCESCVWDRTSRYAD